MLERAIAKCNLSVRLFVSPSVCMSVTLVGRVRLNLNGYDIKIIIVTLYNRAMYLIYSGQIF